MALLPEESHPMPFSATAGKAMRVYRDEGGKEVLRRVGWKLRERATAVLLRWRQQTEPPKPAPTCTEVGQKITSVDVVFCVHNALADVQRCLRSLELCSDPRARLLLVDDGSDPETADFLERYAQSHQLRHIRNPSARGYTKAANQGLRASSSDAVVLLNSDTIVTPGWLQQLLTVISHDPAIGVVGPLSNTASWQSIPHVEADGDWMSNAIPAGLELNEYAAALRQLLPGTPAEVGFLNGFCLLIRRETLQDVGLFDEKTFGQGYGEENDFCLRAHNKGWKLVVALRSYVFHAQSKSYSHERRQQLCAQADQLLDAKHSSALKHQQLAITMEHPLLLFARNASLIAEAVHASAARIQRDHAHRRLLFLLPAAHAGGGSNVVIAEATALRAAGVDVWIANLPANQASFRASYPNLKVPCCSFNLEDPNQLALQTTGFDAVVATHNLSAHWAASLSTSVPEIQLGYYIQDFEPYFYPTGSKGWQTAFDSYTLAASFCHFCKTHWTAATLQREAQVQCQVIGPSVDSRPFAPQSCHHPSHRQTITLVAMIRISCERRQPHLTAIVLTDLKRKFGDRIRLLSFGSSDAELLAHGINPHQTFNNRGKLGPTAVAELLQEADLFLDASSFQAMGLTAMEAMASGCAVIGPQHGGLAEIVGRDGTPLAHCVDTSSRQAILHACSELIENLQNRTRLRKRAFEVSHYQPLLAAENMLNALFSCDPIA